jgi:hypothetical protein
MEEFIVVEQSKTPDGKAFINAAVNFVRPTYIKVNTDIQLKFDDRIQVDEEKNVIKDGQKIGALMQTKTDADIIISTEYDIKYTGGYSVDGKKIYIDRDFPKQLSIGDKTIDCLASIGLHHELVEKWLIDDTYTYPYAHKIATMVERAYVESQGVTWDEYSKEVNKNLSIVSSKKAERSPVDLDMSPYVYDRDIGVISEIRKSQLE